MSRSLPKWVGANNDAMPPPRVRLRIFNRHGGICALSGRKIQVGDKWDLDHAHPLCLGGLNDEDNLRPVLATEHRRKTAGEVSAKAKADRVRAKHIGAKTPSRAVLAGSKRSPWKRKVSGEVVRRDLGE